MDLRFTAEELALRDRIRAFCRSAQPKHIWEKLVLGKELNREDYVEWQQILDKQGWAAPHWPKEWGGTGWTAVETYMFHEELFQAPALPSEHHNVAQVGPVIINFGTDKQRQHFLPKLRNLEYWFCEGFSEPGSGSDLASLKTSAMRDGDHYVVNGSKIWTTVGHMANWMFALVRTDPNAKKQKGISYLLIKLDTPGITIRPIITIDGAHHVNQVFFDNVRVPVENRVGEENKGWDYAKYLMGNSRTSAARIGLTKARIQRAKELAATVIDQGKPLAESLRFREKLAALEVEIKSLEITAMRILADQMKKASTKQDPKVSILKMKGAEMQQLTAQVLLEIAGPFAVPFQSEYLNSYTDESIGPDWAASASPTYFFSRARTISGGSNEVQHNIIAKRILGL